MSNPDIRWIQRFSNYKKALAQLSDAVEQYHSGSLSMLEEQGVIKAFEFTYELAWNVLKDYFEYQATGNITGSRDAIREAFSKGLIDEGEVWMEMIGSRNKTSHTYNQVVAEEILRKIANDYFPQFKKLEQTLKQYE